MEVLETFGWSETRACLERWRRRVELRAEPDRRWFEGRLDDGRTLRFTPPAVQPTAPGQETPGVWLDGLPRSLGLQVVLLVQAGASALGLWEDDELVAHKVVKKYVVRGRGRAQPLHLKTRGKSRYGSRLRLSNARAQLDQTNERLSAWWAEHGPPDWLFVACPVRTWPALLEAQPPPPFDRADARDIPRDVRRPSFEELKRVRRSLVRGRVTAEAPLA